CQHYKSLPLTF
nr:immunoglobulin light chain junction region [Macaca mulatta]MOV37352.1 immunoglobulin light chain junction region [Macaca mulatta]MOV37383.1 immunoglobulin light chain junction region [Macaca mulatta]MOV37422.1 immunoglobulin light chain junction region [Macaca mulatta]MOV37562.1 immunoglobulin light chain junction region [Macaca mulatta]